jgi:hypothetical protein
VVIAHSSIVGGGKCRRVVSAARRRALPYSTPNKEMQDVPVSQGFLRIFYPHIRIFWSTNGPNKQKQFGANKEFLSETRETAI